MKFLFLMVLLTINIKGFSQTENSKILGVWEIVKTMEYKDRFVTTNSMKNPTRLLFKPGNEMAFILNNDSLSTLFKDDTILDRYSLIGKELTISVVKYTIEQLDEKVLVFKKTDGLDFKSYHYKRVD